MQSVDAYFVIQSLALAQIILIESHPFDYISAEVMCVSSLVVDRFVIIMMDWTIIYL